VASGRGAILVSSLSRNQRGIVAICACMASYTVNDVLVKQILHTYPVGEVIFVRGIMSTLMIGAIALAFGHWQELRGAINRQLAARSAFDGLSTAGFIAALAHMQLANLAAVLQIAPLLITALSVLLYREVVGWRRWLAIGIGFIGALLVIKPVPSAFNVWALVGAASALAAALREITTRRIGHGIPVLVVAFWGAVAITFCGLFFAVTEHWLMFAAGDLLQLFVAAVFVGIAIFLLALAFRDVDLSVVAPFRYSYLLTSALGGYLVFRELPDGLTVFGALLIVASGIYTLHREAAQRRMMATRAAAAQ
jgi:drug/metabolite transporter (DMT)-like permease